MTITISPLLLGFILGVIATITFLIIIGCKMNNKK